MGALRLYFSSLLSGSPVIRGELAKSLILQQIPLEKVLIRDSHFATSPPAGCVKVDNSLLFPVRFRHLKSQMRRRRKKTVVPPPTSGFQAGAGISAAGVMLGLGSSSP